LVVPAEAVRVLAVAAVGRPAAELGERGAPRLGAEHAQERGRMERAGADLDVDRLLHDAAAIGPVLLQREDEILQVHGASACGPYPPRRPGVKLWDLLMLFTCRRRARACVLAARRLASGAWFARASPSRVSSWVSSWGSSAPAPARSSS